MTSTGAGSSGVMPHMGPMRGQPSESSASPQASSTTPLSSAMSYQKPLSSLTPSQVYINKENLAGAATYSQVAALGEKLNILIALYRLCRSARRSIGTRLAPDPYKEGPESPRVDIRMARTSL